MVTILSIILSLQVFDVLFTLTGGGPGRSTTVISYYIYQSAVWHLNFGYSAALAVFLLVVIVLCSSALLLVRLRDRSGRRRARRSCRAVARADEHDRARSASAWPRTRTGAVRVAPTPGPGAATRIPAAGCAEGCSRSASGPLLVWLLGPIVWIAITSLQPEGAVTRRCRRA